MIIYPGFYVYQRKLLCFPPFLLSSFPPFLLSSMWRFSSWTGVTQIIKGVCKGYKTFFSPPAIIDRDSFSLICAKACCLSKEQERRRHKESLVCLTYCMDRVLFISLHGFTSFIN